MRQPPVVELPSAFEALAAESAGSAVDPRDARHVLLQQICEGHCLLDVRFNLGAEAYQSAILELVPGAGYLVLDALTPANGNLTAATLPGIRARTRLHGMDLKFATRIIQHGSQGGLPYYKVRYPESVDFPQRRRDYRVAVPFDRGVLVRFHTRDGTLVRGEVRDLSASGFCARLLSGDTTKIAAESGQHELCEIDLPGYDTVRAVVEVCHLLPSRARSAPRVGARFIDLDARAERQLERCVAELDRTRLRLG